MRALAVAMLLLCAACVGAGCIGFVKKDRDGATPSASASTSASPSATEPWKPDTALFVHVARSFGFNRTSGDGAGPSLAMGHHCGGASWTTNPPAVTVHDWRPESSGTGGASTGSITSYTWTGTGSSGTTTSGPPPDQWGPSGILVQSIDQGNITNRSYMAVGHGAEASGFDARNETFGVLRAFGPRTVIVPIEAWGGNVRVGGTLLEPGVPHVERVAYVFSEGPSDAPTSFSAYETLTFTLHGEATVTNRVMGNYCI